MRNINITGLPAGKGRNVQEMSDWFCWHVQRVRDLIAKSPSHTLVEVDIEDPGTSQRMQDLFAIHKDCWGHANVNVALHPELSKTSTGNLPWFSHGRRIRGGGLVLNTSETSDVP